MAHATKSNMFTLILSDEELDYIYTAVEDRAAKDDQGSIAEDILDAISEARDNG